MVSGDGASGYGSPNGIYTFDGPYNSFDSFVRGDSLFYIWHTGTWWVISPAKGNQLTSWRMAGVLGPNGSYAVRLSTTGTPVVANE